MIFDHYRADGSRVQVVLDLPPGWSFPGGESETDIDAQIDTVKREASFRPDTENGIATVRLADVAKFYPEVRAVAELNGCRVSILAAMIAALFIFDSEESPVGVQILGDRDVAQEWVMMAVTIFNYRFGRKAAA